MLARGVITWITWPEEGEATKGTWPEEGYDHHDDYD
jgi:hypothetical protein